jgi:hypothetical protein
MWQMRSDGDGMYARIEPKLGQPWYQESQNGARNEAWMDAINASGHVLLSSTLLPSAEGLSSRSARGC